VSCRPGERRRAAAARGCHTRLADVLAAQRALPHDDSPAHLPVPCRAAAGYFFQEFLAIPGYPGYTPNGIDAATAVPPEAMLQVRRTLGPPPALPLNTIATRGFRMPRPR
jgi:hypothetical protein